MKKWQWVQTGALQGISLGTVRFNLQQTSEDGKMTLRLFGRSDDLVPAIPNREFQTLFVSFSDLFGETSTPNYYFLSLS